MIPVDLIQDLNLALKQQSFVLELSEDKFHSTKSK